jgi:tRNA-2-methylthio-N6-dimethylallyladenosine synthase
MLEAFGYERAPDVESENRASGKSCEGGSAFARRDADIIVVNTCSVRENADNKFFGLLGQLKHVKESDPNKIIAVCGCMMQQRHVVDEIRKKCPWVDIIFGAMNIEAFPSMLTEATEKRRGAPGNRADDSQRATSVDVRTDRSDIVEGLPSRRKHPYKAFVNIMYGCDNFCTYCIVPYTRGRERSRTPEAICGEVRTLAADGVKEITLLGQNVNSYKGRETDFPSLIRLIDDIPGVERIRFMTSHPKDLSDELIDCYRTTRNLCPSIHLPVQSGSTEVLRRMNRGYSKESYLSLTDRLREARSDIVISTDFIVGFPGETDADFDETMDLIERARFDAAFTFLYSPRAGTPAASYEDHVPADVAHARFDRMVNRLNEITKEKNLAMLGGVYDVLIEGPSKTDKTMLAGRTPGGKLVNVKPPENPNRAEATQKNRPSASSSIGEIVAVRLTKAGTFSFIGEFA